MNIAQHSFNWFDLLVVIILATGVIRGRRRGMSEELLDVFEWLTIVVLGALLYPSLGNLVADFTRINLWPACILSYLFVLVTIRLFFGWIKHLVGEKLVGSDVFGAGEYYLGMLAGGVRFACYLIVVLALLNAKYISPEQLASTARMQQENFGDISFPTIGTLQQTIFAGSASGRWVKRYLADQLIATAPDRKTAQVETLGRQRERAIYEVLGDKR